MHESQEHANIARDLRVSIVVRRWTAWPCRWWWRWSDCRR